MESETHTTEGLEQLRDRIEHWRRTRQKRGPMPAALWEEAASLARALGVSPVSRSLHLGYDALQEWVRSGGDGGRACPPPVGAMTRFVELSGAQIVGTVPESGAVVEVASGDGASLTIRLPAGSSLDIAALVRAFRGPRS